MPGRRRALSKTPQGGLESRQKERGPGECATMIARKWRNDQRKKVDQVGCSLFVKCVPSVCYTNLLVNAKPDGLETSRLCLFLPSPYEFFPA